MALHAPHPSPHLRANRIKRSAAVLAVAIIACACVRAAQADIPLGAAENFAVLGASTVTNTGPSVITGDLGVSPGSAIIGFPPGIVLGTIHGPDTVATQAQTDAGSAFVALGNLPVTQDLSSQNLGNRTLTPGVYHFSSSAQLTGTLTLDGLGQADPLFVFQIGTTLTTASASSIVEINGADVCDAYFQVGSSATLGAGTSFIGTIIASDSDTLVTGANLNGRVIALTGAVTLDTNAINNTCAVGGAAPEPATASLLALSLLPLLIRRRK